ncbi:MAG: VOC family protein [Pseudobdellovibrionaceae bacterium]
MKTQQFNFANFKIAGETFLNHLVNDLETQGIPAKSLNCDHLCFRISTLDEYDFYKSNLSSYGDLLTESKVHGRPICTYKLHDAFQTDDHRVTIVELPAPKLGVIYPLGFEHAEFIINDCFDSFSEKFAHLKFIEGQRKTLNPELCLRINNKQAKFHHHSLERIIEIEKADIKHIIFDLDGTLIKSRENIYEINRIVFSKILERVVSIDESIANYHPEFYKMFEAFSVVCPTKRATTISDWGSVSEQFTYHLFDGIIELLQELLEYDFKLHLWTARDEQSARKILSDLKMESFFSTLSFASDIDSKPHPRSLCFDWKSANNDQVLVIGDSPSDIVGSKNIHALGGAALWDPYAKRNSMMISGAELFFYEISNLKNWLFKQ